jgi:hypothetical protein
MPLAAPSRSLSPPPIARSAAGPGPLPWRSAARGAGHAADASPDCAGPRRRAIAVCSARSSSSTPGSASIAGPGADWSEPSRGDRSRRSPPCAEASQGAAPLGSSSPSGAELLAPLRPTTGKHASTTLRSHASAEAVFPLPGALLGLVGPLHECVPVLVQRRRSGSITQERLASSPASRDGPVLRPVSLCPAILATRRAECQTSNPPPRELERIHCRCRKGAATLPRPPRPDAHLTGSRAPRGRSSTPSRNAAAQSIGS